MRSCASKPAWAPDARPCPTMTTRSPMDCTAALQRGHEPDRAAHHGREARRRDGLVQRHALSSLNSARALLARRALTRVARRWPSPGSPSAVRDRARLRCGLPTHHKSNPYQGDGEVGLSRGTGEHVLLENEAEQLARCVRPLCLELGHTGRSRLAPQPVRTILGSGVDRLETRSPDSLRTREIAGARAGARSRLDRRGGGASAPLSRSTAESPRSLRVGSFGSCCVRNQSCRAEGRAHTRHDVQEDPDPGGRIAAATRRDLYRAGESVPWTGGCLSCLGSCRT